MSKISKQASKRENSLGIYFAIITPALVTIWFQTKTQDPFNLPKFEVLILLAPFSLYFIKNRINRKLDSAGIRIILSILLFFLLAFFSAALSNGNIYQSMIGVYQRNLGFLTYFCFAILFFAVMVNITFNNWRKLLNVFVCLGTLETFYGLIQYANLDPIKWKNSYSPILGTFGNPNYQSAFLGTTSAAAVALLFFVPRFLRVLLAIQVIISLSLILVSNSSQGFMAFGLIVGGLVCFQMSSNLRKFLFPVVIIFVIGIFLGLFGILNKGPASFLYQASISARGDYWRAGIAMLKDHPLNGVGVERFGEFFGFYRDLNQVRSRSFATYSDNAHNVFIQFGATGGFPLLLGYIFLWVCVLVFGVVRLRKLTGVQAKILSTFIVIFIGLVTVSLISPENIGFSIWSWIFAGAIVGLSLQPFEENLARRTTVGRSSDDFIWLSAILLIFTAPAIYLVQSVYKADQGIWNSYAIAYGGKGSLESLLISIEKNVSHAPSEQRYKAIAASLGIGLGQYSVARNYADLVLEINPRSIDAYRIIAISYEKENNFTEAIKNRLKYLEFDRFNLDNLDKLARDNLVLGNKIRALGYLKTMKEIQAENPLVLALEKDLTT